MDNQSADLMRDLIGLETVTVGSIEPKLVIYIANYHKLVVAGVLGHIIDLDIFHLDYLPFLFL
jgi:hypothetical protein